MNLRIKNLKVMGRRFAALGLVLLFAAFTAQAQTGRDQKQAIPAALGDHDIPEKKTRYYSKEAIEDWIRSTPQYEKAVQLNLNVVVNYEYFVISGERAVFYSHHYEKPLREVSLTADVWHFYIRGTFNESGNCITGLSLENSRLPPSPEMLQKEQDRLEQIRLEAERIEKERLEKERTRKEQEEANAEKQRLADIQAEKERLAIAKLQAEEEEKRLIADAKEQERLRVDGERILEQKRIEVNKTLIFKVPKEPTVGFIIDHSGSIEMPSQVPNYTYLELAKEHLKTTLQLLRSTQKFVVGFSGESSDALFNDGQLLEASEENISAAMRWIDAYKLSGKEDFDLTLKMIAANQLPKRILMFTDGVITPDRNVTQDSIKIVRGRSVVDIVPIPNDSFFLLKKANFSSAEFIRQGWVEAKKGSPTLKKTPEDIAYGKKFIQQDGCGFIKKITEATGGTLLKQVNGLPDPDAVSVYKQWIEKINRARASKKK